MGVLPGATPAGLPFLDCLWMLSVLRVISPVLPKSQVAGSFTVPNRTRSDVDQVDFPRWHLDFLIFPKVFANWLWGSTLLFFMFVIPTDGPGTPFSSRLHCPCPALDAGPSGSFRSLAESRYCSSRNLGVYFRRFSRTTLSFRVTGKHLVLSPSSTPHTRQTNLCSADLVCFSGTLFWNPSLRPADSHTYSAFSSRSFWRLLCY